MKKVLSFVLVLALVLSSFSMAFAGVGEKTVNNLSDIAGNANEEAIQVVNDLGIVTGNPDGTFQPEKAVTRAEFAAMVTRALGIPESALAGYASTSFKDTNGYGWAVPYLAFCNSKGIMLGDGAGNAMPGKTITNNEAITMVLRAVGYTANSSELVGVWPSNYVTKAQDLDLYDDVSKATVVDKANAAQIIYNALTVVKVSVDADGKTDYVTGNPNMLTGGLNCSVNRDEVVTSADYDDSLIDVTKYLGAFGDKYYNDDDELVAFDKASTTLVGEMDKDEFKVGDINYKFGTGVVSIGAVIANSVVSDTAIALSRAQLKSLEDASQLDLVINADVTGKTIKEVYSVVVWEASSADLAAKEVQDDIEDNELLSDEFVEDKDGNIDLTQFSLVGVKSLKDIKEDDVVYTFTDGKNIRMVAVGQKQVEGKITKVDDNDVYINGEWYAISDVAKTTLTKSDIGKEYKLYLDAYGDYFKADKINGKVATFGVIKAVQPSGVDNYKVKMYTSADTTKTFVFNDDVDDIDYLTNGSDFDYNAVSFAAIVTDGGFVGYELDKNGEIDTLDIGATEVATATAKLKSNKVFNDGTKDYDIDSDVVVMTYDNNNDGTDKYDVIKVSEVEKNIALTGKVWFITNDDEDVVAILLKDDPANTDKDTDEVYGVFSGRVDMQNDDDDEIFEYEGFIGTTAGDYKTEDNDGAEKHNVGDAALIGSLFKIELTTDGTIDTMVNLLNTPAAKDANSGAIVTGAVITDGGVKDGGTVLQMNDGTKYTVSEKATVYKCTLKDNGNVKKYEVKSLSSLKKNYTVFLYDTEGDDCDMIADVVIYVED